MSTAELTRTIGAADLAARFGVPAAIHSGDFLFHHHMEQDYGPGSEGNPPGSEIRRRLVTELYFTDGDRSARQLDALVQRFHRDHGKRRLTLLDFAAGYGCVARHLARLDGYALTACDIHGEAVAFLEHELDIRAQLSVRDPAAFLTRRFDVIFALSFFTHMPDASWGRWLHALYYHLERDGLLIFTTAGRVSHERLGRPRLDALGSLFTPVSEQRDLPTDEYGSTLVTPGYVIDRIDGCPNAELVHFETAAWWGAQDLWIVRKTGTRFARDALAERAALLDTVACLRASTSWRLTAPIRAIGSRFGKR